MRRSCRRQARRCNVLMRSLKNCNRPICGCFIVRRAGSLIFATISARTKRRFDITRRRFKPGIELKDLSHSDLGTLLNNVAMIYRKSRAAESGRALLPARARNLRKATRTGTRRCRLGLEQSRRCSTRTSGDSRKRKKRICARWPFGRKFIRRIIPTSRNPSAIWPWFIIRAAITRARPSFTAPRSRRWEETTAKPPKDYEIVASNYADLLRSLGKARKANAARGTRAEKTAWLSDRLACARRWLRQFRGRIFATLTWRNGRRVRLRTVWGNPWRFNSSREH